jgi:hypothetical protein
MKLWKVQKVFGDVVYDLRSRGLLPVVILLVVAMVAVPVLISRGSKGSSNASLQASSVTNPTPETENAVVSYSPGIREYKRRLNDLSAKDPFRQQFAPSAASAAAASQLSSTAAVSSGSGSVAGASTGTSSSTPDTTTLTGGGSSGGSSGGSGKKKHKATVTYQANLLAGAADATLTPFNDVATMTPLPSQTAPVVLYYGLTSDNNQALFLVSNKVASLAGPGTCVPSPEDCALLTLGPGRSEDLVYAGDGKTYRIVVAAIKTIKK